MSLLVWRSPLCVAVCEVSSLIPEPQMANAAIDYARDFIHADLVIPNAGPDIAGVADEQACIANRACHLFPRRTVAALTDAIENEEAIALLRDIPCPQPARPELGMLLGERAVAINGQREPILSNHWQASADGGVSPSAGSAAIEASPESNLLSMGDEISSTSNAGSGRGTLGRHQDHPWCWPRAVTRYGVTYCLHFTMPG